MPFSIPRAAIRAAALVGCCALVAYPAAAQAAACRWYVVTSPNGAPDQNRLTGIAADSARDAWAVGFYLENGALAPLTERWNGSKWAVVSAPNAGPYDNVLQAVTAAGPTDAWAVGYYWNGSANEPLIEHWNGKAWAVSPNPTGASIDPGGAILFAVSAVSPNDVWAAGEISTSNAGNTMELIEHWNGVRWSIVAAPNRNRIENTLYGIGVVNASNIWFGGVFAPTAPGFNQTLVDHFNGKTLTRVPTTDANVNSNNINAIAALPGGSAFAAGDYYNSKAGVFETLASRWNGKAWIQTPSPNAGKYETDLAGIAAVSPTEVLAVGHYVQAQVLRTYAMLWNGVGWSAAIPPNVTTNGDYLDAASAIPGTVDVWAAGGTENPNQSVHQTLIEWFHC